MSTCFTSSGGVTAFGNGNHVIAKFCGPSSFEPSKVVSVAFVDPKWTCFGCIEDSSILTSESLRNTFIASLVAAFTSSAASTSIAKTEMIHDYIFLPRIVSVRVEVCFWAMPSTNCVGLRQYPVSGLFWGAFLGGECQLTESALGFSYRDLQQLVATPDVDGSFGDAKSQSVFT